VALAGIFSALRVSGGKLSDQTLLFLGAGEAATGIADLVVSAMVAQGCPQAEAQRRNWLFDSRGLVVKDRAELAEHKLAYAHEHAPIADFLTAIRALRPTAIIGVAAVGGTFTHEVLQTMAQINERPIVFALSNPTSKAECTAEEAYRHTQGRALFACGSPYDPVKLDGKTFVPRQGEQLLHFPGTRARRDREPDAAHHRRDVHGRRACARGPRERRRPRAGEPLPGAAAHPRGIGAYRREGRGGRLPARPRGRAGAAGRAGACQVANVRAALLQLRVTMPSA
jgi:Malic enzyme, NAD binding domain